MPGFSDWARRRTVHAGLAGVLQKAAAAVEVAMLLNCIAAMQVI